MDSFTQYDIAARRIRDLPTTSETQRKLQKAIHQQATSFLHLHMLPLKSLPKILKHAAPNGAVPFARSNGTANGTRPNDALTAIKHADAADTSSQVSNSSSNAISALEEEEKALRQQLIVLEEQKFFVGEMVADANRRRKFDEAASLAQNLRDLTREIDQVQGRVALLDFEGAYAGEQDAAGRVK